MTRRSGIRHAGDAVRSSARVAAWHLINAESPIGEQRLFALVDAVASLLNQGTPGVTLETARRAFETVVVPRVALAAVRALVEDDEAMSLDNPVAGSAPIAEPAPSCDGAAPHAGRSRQ